MNTEIVKQTLIDSTQDNRELDIFTPFVVRTVNVPTLMRVPLYVNGTLKSAEELAELGLIVKSYTQAELDEKKYNGYYTKNPRLAERIRQYVGLLNIYNLPVTASSDDISNAITQDNTKTEAEKTVAGAGLLALIHDIEINFNEVSGEGLTAWEELPKLIEYLPAVTETETVTE